MIPFARGMYGIRFARYLCPTEHYKNELTLYYSLYFV